MRRIAAFIASAVVLAVPAAALAASLDDGTLTVTDGYGTIQIGLKDANGDPVSKAATGAVVGSIANGTVWFMDPAENDTNDFQTSGCDKVKSTKDNTISCTGSKIRYRVVGGQYRLKISGSDIDLSAVGRGTVTVNGDLSQTNDSGKYRLNDADWKQIPDKPKSFQLEH